MSPPPAALSAPPSMENLLAIFRHRWLAMVVFGGVAALAAATVAWLVTPGKYTASVVIQVPKIKGVNETETEQINFQRAASALAKSSTVQDKVVADPDVAGLNETRSHGDPVGWLAKDLTTDNLLLGGDMFRINLSGDYPEDVAVILNKLVQIYNKEFAAREESRTRLQQDQLKEKYHSLSRLVLRPHPLSALQEREKAAGVEDSTAGHHVAEAETRHEPADRPGNAARPSCVANDGQGPTRPRSMPRRRASRPARSRSRSTPSRAGNARWIRAGQQTPGGPAETGKKGPQGCHMSTFTTGTPTARRPRS